MPFAHTNSLRAVTTTKSLRTSDNVEHITRSMYVAYRLHVHTHPSPNWTSQCPLWVLMRWLLAKRWPLSSGSGRRTWTSVQLHHIELPCERPPFKTVRFNTFNNSFAISVGGSSCIALRGRLRVTWRKSSFTSVPPE